MPIIKAELRRQPAAGKNIYQFSLEIETDLTTADNKREEDVPSARNKADDTESYGSLTMTQDEDPVRNKTYIKIGKSRIVVTDTTDEVKDKKKERKRIILKRKKSKSAQAKSKSAGGDTEKKKRRFKVIKAPHGSTNEDEQDLFVIKSSEVVEPVTHLDKWINEDYESQLVTESVEVKKESVEVKIKPNKKKSKLKKDKRTKKNYKLYEIKMAPVEPKIAQKVPRPFQGYRSTKQGFGGPRDLENETSRVLNVVYDANGEPMNHILMESYSYIPTQRKPLLNFRALDNGEIVTIAPRYNQLIRSEASENVQSQNPNGLFYNPNVQNQAQNQNELVYNPSLRRDTECQSTKACKVDQSINVTSSSSSTTTTSNFNLTSATPSTVTTEEVKVDLRSMLNKMSESQMLDNITNILLDKLYDKVATKNLDSDKDVDTVEKIEIELDPVNSDNNQEAAPNKFRALNRFKYIERNKGFFFT